jgi:hypothetical protein
LKLLTPQKLANLNQKVVVVAEELQELGINFRHRDLLVIVVMEDFQELLLDAQREPTFDA